MFEWVREKYWDFKEWWFFRKSPIKKCIDIPCPPLETVTIEGIRLVNVHDPALCEGRVCVVHNPTDHHMRGWKLHWRGDRGIFERICPCHGIGHPDPDQGPFWEETDQEWQWVHGCCGACHE